MAPIRAWALQLKRQTLTLLGYLDDVVIVPAGIWLALRLIPAAVMETARQQAERADERPTSTAAAIVVVLIWVAPTALSGWWIYQVAT